MNFSLQDCLTLVAENSVFYHQSQTIDGHQVDLFNYRLANYSDFVSAPFALEMRGLCFVDGKRYLSLNKFFNLNETEGVQYNDVRDKKIVSVSEKADGSLIRFVQIGDSVRAKSKMSFDSDQALAAQRIYNTNKNIREFVDFTLTFGLAAQFEYVAPANQIVVLYSEEKLLLHSVRGEQDGVYMQPNGIKHLVSRFAGVETVDQDLDFDLDIMIELMPTLKDIEGFVVQFDDGQIVKLKTQWYLNLHGLLTEKIGAANHVCRFCFEDVLDDVLAQVPESMTEVRKSLINTHKTISQWVAQKIAEVEAIAADYAGDRKAWALRNKEHELFGLAVNVVFHQRDVESLVREYGVKKTKNLEDAVYFLETIS